MTRTLMLSALFLALGVALHAEPAEADPRAVTLNFQVVDHNGAAVPDAFIYVAHWQIDDDPVHGREQGWIEDSGYADASGKFTHTVKMSDRDGDAMTLTFHASRADRTCSGAVKLKVTPGSTHEVKIAFPNAGTISGRVTDVDGNPIAGARIFTSPTGYTELSQPNDMLSEPAHREKPFAARTDAEGNFTIKGVIEGKYHVMVYANGFTNLRGPQVTVKEGEATEIEDALRPKMLTAIKLNVSGVVQPAKGRTIRVQLKFQD